MQKLRKSSGPLNYGETSWENGGITETFGYQDSEIVIKANSIPIRDVLKKYNINIQTYETKIVCPFPCHIDKTPSFIIYDKTNTFWCFGCKVGTKCCDFVAEFEKTNKAIAASKILDFFSDQIENQTIKNQINYVDQFNIILKFSELIRNFLKNNNDKKALEFIDEVCVVYDKINEKYKLSNEALENLYLKMKDKIENF